MFSLRHGALSNKLALIRAFPRGVGAPSLNQTKERSSVRGSLRLRFKEAQGPAREGSGAGKVQAPLVRGNQFKGSSE